MNGIKVLGSLVMILAACGTARAGIVDWEDLIAGTQYSVGVPFSSGGVQIMGGEFFWLPSGSTLTGFAEVDNNLMSGGSGLDMNMNNINLDFNFGGPLTSLSLLYGDHGGNVNININGDFRNLADLTVIHGSNVGGVAVSAVGMPFGQLDLTGTISSFSIGGQELWIDDVNGVPEPTTLVLLALGGLGLISGRRAHRG